MEDYDWPLNAGDEVVSTESSTATVGAKKPSSTTRGRKKKVKPSQTAGPFTSAESSNVAGSSNGRPSIEAVLTQMLALQESVKELMTIQKKMQKQMMSLVAVPVTKEGTRVEVALNQSMEKALKSNCDALWDRIEKENKKQELERDRIKQITSSISGSMNTKWPAMFKKTLKKEIAAVGPAGACAITPILEKTVSSAIADSFQKGVGNMSMNQLEKSVNSKLEATVARQIQAQFQTSGKQAFQDALRASLESSLIPAFEQACKAMFEQVDAVIQKGMIEHTSAARQQFEFAHSPLALALRDAMRSASSITQTLSGELADGQRNLLAFMAGGANQKVMNPLVAQQSDGPLSGLNDKAMTVQQVEATLDPKKELERLISERKYGEAFTSALQGSDINIVSWLCSQVDLQGILSVLPLPLSQGVLLSLLHQLACDIGNETSQKIDWMRDVLVAIDPVDPTIVMHVRPIFEQVYQILDRQRVLLTTTTAETSSIRLVMHLMTTQKKMQKQMMSLAAVPVTKEGTRVEVALSQSMEKALKSNCDALWDRIEKENKKQELERDRIKQITSSISGSMNTKWPAMFKKTLKKEIAAVGPAGARAITPILEKTVSSAIADSFQKGVGNMSMNQLEKSVNSKLEATVARQIQAQFQTSGKQAFQDALRASLESSLIPAFEQACKAMFKQVDAAIQKGMIEHTSAAQQQFESAHSPLALVLRDAMSSASSITQTLSGELADGQRNLLAFMAGGANQKVMNPLAAQQSDGPLSGLNDKAMTVQQVEATLDPKKELERLISERKYGEAFTSALQGSDINIVSWLCSQVHLQGILLVLPLPLSQGVLLSLLHQLACDIGNETSQKLDWMRDVLVAIDPVDPTIVIHGRPIFESRAANIRTGLSDTGSPVGAPNNHHSRNKQHPSCHACNQFSIDELQMTISLFLICAQTVHGF